jgi:hypothetical protein
VPVTWVSGCPSSEFWWEIWYGSSVIASILNPAGWNATRGAGDSANVSVPVWFATTSGLILAACVYGSEVSGSLDVTASPLWTNPCPLGATPSEGASVSYSPNVLGNLAVADTSAGLTLPGSFSAAGGSSDMINSALASTISGAPSGNAAADSAPACSTGPGGGGTC